MDDDNLGRIKTALFTLLACIERTENDVARLVAKAESIESELTKSDELLAGLRDIRAEHYVQGGILLRLEHRDRTSDGTTLALQQQIHRLQERIRTLEDKIDGM